MRQVGPEGHNVLLSFGDTTPIRLGGPSLVRGALSVSTDTEWQEAAPFTPGAWHELSVEFAAARFILRVDDGPPRAFEAAVGDLNPRLYLGEGIVVGEPTLEAPFEFVVDLGRLRTRKLAP